MNEKRITRQFSAPWWLPNRHLQTTYSTIFPPLVGNDVTWEQLELPDGDFIDLCWSGPTKSPIIILLHGLEGSVKSPYIRLMLDCLSKAGWRVVVMHFRGCSGRLNRLAQSYHAGYIYDLEFLINTLRKRFASQMLSAIGFSLGGNVLLHYLARNTAAPVNRAIAISVPFDCSSCSDSISTFYRLNLLTTMKEKTIQKIRQNYDGMPVSVKEVRSISSFRVFDDAITAPLHGFVNATDYYESSNIRPWLKTIEHPVLIIHAQDDPLVPANGVPTARELSCSTRLELSTHGGHVGFISGSSPWNRQFWLKDRILDFLKNPV